MRRRYAYLRQVLHLRLRIARLQLRKARLRLALAWAKLQNRYLRFRLWLLIGGAVARHPQHYLVWTANMAVLAATGIAATFGPWFALRILGLVPLAFAFYIMLSFFLPLPLPPIRSEELVRRRRVRLEELSQQEAEQRRTLAEQENALEQARDEPES